MEEIKKIQTTILSKETLRASDYRKAVILIYIKIKDLICDKRLVQLFCTAVEICHICYSRESERTPRVILRLHNVTFSCIPLHKAVCISKNINTKENVWKYSILSHHPMYMYIYTRASSSQSAMGYIILLTARYSITFPDQRTRSRHIYMATIPVVMDIHYDASTFNGRARGARLSEIARLSCAEGRKLLKHRDSFFFCIYQYF